VSKVVCIVEHVVIGIRNLKLLHFLRLVSNLTDSCLDIVLCFHEVLILSFYLVYYSSCVDIAFPFIPVNFCKTLVRRLLVIKFNDSRNLSKFISRVKICWCQSQSIQPFIRKVLILLCIVDNCSLSGFCWSCGGLTWKAPFRN